MIQFENFTENIWVIYVLKSLLTTGVLWLVCLAALRTTRYGVMRGMILFSALAGAIIPLVRIGVFEPAPVASFNEFPQIMMVEPIEYSEPVAAATTDYTPYIIVGIYTLVALVMFSRSLWGALSIIRIGKSKKINGLKICQNDKITSPFSFLGTIYIGKETSDKTAMVLAHESAHIRHHHSREVLLMEFLRSLLWFNPFIHLLQKQLREIHEYQADSDVCQAGFDPQTYKELIFQSVVGGTPNIAEALTNSLTKKRIIMITRNIRRGTLRALLLLPATALLLSLVSFTEREATATEPQELRKPLFVVDGKIIEKASIEDFNADSIAGVVIVKGEKAVEKYGKGAEAGAVEISLRKAGNTDPISKHVTTLGIPKNTLIIINGEESQKLPAQNNISEIVVLKGEQAVKAFGERAKDKDGAMVIVTKDFRKDTTITLHQTFVVKSEGDSLSNLGLNGKINHITLPPNGTNIVTEVRGLKYKDGADPLVIIDDKVYQNKEASEKLRQLNPENLKSMTVLKGEKAVEMYGEKGKNGAIIVTTKLAPTASAQPSFQGQDPSRFSNYIVETISYPEELKGKVSSVRFVVSFTIGTNNEMKNIKVTSKTEGKEIEILKESILKAVKNSPKEWKAAEVDGKKIEVPVKLPIVYQSEADKNTTAILKFNEQHFNNSVENMYDRMIAGISRNDTRTSQAREQASNARKQATQAREQASQARLQATQAREQAAKNREEFNKIRNSIPTV